MIISIRVVLESGLFNVRDVFFLFLLLRCEFGRSRIGRKRIIWCFTVNCLDERQHWIPKRRCQTTIAGLLVVIDVIVFTRQVIHGCGARYQHCRRRGCNRRWRNLSYCVSPHDDETKSSLLVDATGEARGRMKAPTTTSAKILERSVGVGTRVGLM